MTDEGVLVLVVEDEALIRMDIAAALGEAGFTVTEASSGERAITSLSDDAANYRAVITDINLGGPVSGWDVARHARHQTPDMPIIYAPSVSADEWAAEGVPNSILVHKPYVTTQILTAVAQLLNSGS